MGDVNAAHPVHGGTCLHVAAGLLAPDLAPLLVAVLCELGGANVNARALNSSTPLHWAAGAGNATVVTELLGRGADPSLVSYTWSSNVFGKGSGQTPAHWAAESGHQACIEALLEGSILVPFAEDERGQLPTDLACREGHDAVQLALEDVASTEM